MKWSKGRAPGPSAGRRSRVAVLALGGLLLAGCTNGQSPGATGAQQPAELDTGELTFAVVSHSRAGDPFWDVVKSGAEQAGEEHGAAINYSGDPDPVQQSQLIDNAVAQGVNGLVISMANPEGVKSSVESAVEAGIPVITINSGLEQSASYGAITHVGQSERMAGEAAGERFTDNGASKVLCVIHEAGNVGLEDRCAGAKEKFAGDTENLQVDVSNVADARTTIQNKLMSDKDVDGILTLNPAIANAAVGAARDAESEAEIATFDVSPDITKAIAAGDLGFAVDQQPYVQGYLPVTMLALKVRNGNDVGGGRPVYSGPAFITKDNAEQVTKFAEQGTR
ncbi:monosaccharide ABC transporter substrate-binding protein (CUT2 family) [Murinocardiopsis flavida]|uniref:Monosaccharide ABC transporter substrate-binding protein (CUT2 family) n=1 Tax=Murinocardiopsis flavida TaxID=645275 RepID=A0A2P8DN18_9ACTN|nr:substrate-binding domain-containing protein [Murinocardiopsis flavida]PSK98603.1 monosaccharide ABC transporter substrate-binding protein (CUT2 family) [Murinocardiopsis flavida]